MNEPHDIETFSMTGNWLAAAEALTDEHHVVAVSDDEAARIRFGSYLTMQTEQLRDTEVCPIYGRFVRSIGELAYMIERGAATKQPNEPTLDGMTETLRHVHRTTRRRFIIWHDAHVLAEHDPALFHQVTDVMTGVAAEQEYASEDLLVLTRCLLIGTPTLATHPAFDGWWAEGDSQPFWQVVSGLSQPPIKRVRLT